MTTALPQKNQSAYLHYCSGIRASIQLNNPGIKSVEIVKKQMDECDDLLLKWHAQYTARRARARKLGKRAAEDKNNLELHTKWQKAVGKVDVAFAYYIQLTELKPKLELVYQSALTPTTS